jgi:hypothetical protein
MKAVLNKGKERSVVSLWFNGYSEYMVN